MKKNIFLFLLVFFSNAMIFAGPFGLSNGMTLEEVTKACGGTEPHKIDDNRYIIWPEKTHSVFKSYYAWISDDFGLYYLRVASKPVDAVLYGEEIKNEFYSFEKRLEKFYGPGELIDSRSNYVESRGWFGLLDDGAVKQAVKWNFLDKETKPEDDLTCVFLKTVFKENGWDKTIRLVLDYEFLNKEKVDAQEDELL